MTTVTLIPGSDPSAIDAVREAVAASGAAVEWDIHPLDEAGLPRVISSASVSRVVLKGRTGPRAHPLNSLLRRGLDLVASTRRCMTLGDAQGPFADALLIRDNTRPSGRPGPPAPTTLAAIRFALRHTVWSSRKRITVAGDDDFGKAALDLARDYPQLQVATGEIPETGEADVVLMSAATADGGLWNRMIEAVGGAAHCAGGSYGADFAVFEADPLGDADGSLKAAHLLSAAMLLEHLNEGMAADRIIKSVKAGLMGRSEPSR